ncbi:MAG: hypothetical protein CMH65_07730 [Nevskiales bacterium]|uniref:HTH luxR-type domain-containing protein n=2 Tax=Abyssibacter profundi TaxID=2182787 RepID=A0A363UN62_9GAMM|nr:hypothetical protein [Nevskiales bacterium]PWN56850.1 hypothetical protein DEH80_05385 [Abyssibacter profundi]
MLTQPTQAAPARQRQQSGEGRMADSISDLVHLDQKTSEDYFRRNAWLVDALCGDDAAFMLLDESALVGYVSGGARCLLGSLPALRIHQGRLSSQRAQDRAVLDELCHRVRGIGQGGLCDPDHLFTLGAVGTHRRLVVQLTWAGRTRLQKPGTLVVLRLFEESPQIRISRRMLCKHYGLTSTEAALAASLAEGKPLSKFRLQQGTAMSTVRTQLRHVFRKVGVNSQAALIHTLLTGPMTWQRM